MANYWYMCKRQMAFFSLGVSVLVEVLRELCGLAGSGLADDDDDAVVADDVEQLLADGEDGQVLPLLLDALLLRELGLLLLVNLNVQGKVREFLIVDISTSITGQSKKFGEGPFTYDVRKKLGLFRFDLTSCHCPTHATY